VRAGDIQLGRAGSGWAEDSCLLFVTAVVPFLGGWRMTTIQRFYGKATILVCSKRMGIPVTGLAPSRRID